MRSRPRRVSPPRPGGTRRELIMKKISKETARRKSVSNVLASLRIEHLMPSEYVVTGLKACLSGQHTTSQVLQEVMRHHVTLRRV